MIDNELLTVGGLPLLDLCNAAHCLDKQHAQTCADVYLELSTSQISADEARTLEAAWLARRVGSAFVATDLPQASRLLAQYQSGESVLPIQLINATD